MFLYDSQIVNGMNIITKCMYIIKDNLFRLGYSSDADQFDDYVIGDYGISFNHSTGYISFSGAVWSKKYIIFTW